MSDIFISYASKDRERILPLVRAIKKTGWPIFWDLDIRTKENWIKVLGHKVKKCKCMIVLWSNESINSHWVLEEASEGLKRDILFPVLLDNVDIPFGFKNLQTADLRGWDGIEESKTLAKLIEDIKEFLNEPTENKDDARYVDEEWSERPNEPTENLEDEIELTNSGPAGTSSNFLITDKLPWHNVLIVILCIGAIVTYYTHFSDNPEPQVITHFSTGNRIIDDAIKSALGKDLLFEESMTKVVSLDLSNTGIQSYDLANIADLVNLESLDLYKTNVDDGALVYLKKLPKLNNLDIVGTLISATGVKELTGLQTLYIDASKIAGDSVRNIEKMPNLKSLYIDKWQFGPTVISTLKNTRPELRVVKDTRDPLGTNN